MSYSFLTFILGTFFQTTLGVSSILITTIVSLIIVLTLEPLKRVISIATDSIFFKAKVDYQKVLRKAVNILNTEIELETLVRALTLHLEQSIKLGSTILLLPNKRGTVFDAWNHDRKSNVALKIQNPLFQYIKNHPEIVVFEEFQRETADIADNAKRTAYERIQTSFEALSCGMIVPIVVKKRLMAMLLVGKKLSGDAFSNDDVDLFEVLAPQVGTSIIKSQLYQAVKDFNVKLSRKVDEATRALKKTNFDLEQRNHFLSAMQHITNLIIRSLDFQKAAQILVDEIDKELGYLGGIFYFLDKTKRHLQVKSVTSSPLTKKAIALLPKDYTFYKVDVRDAKSLVAKTFRTGKMQIGDYFHQFTSKAFSDNLAKQIQKVMRIKSMASVPVFDESSVVGVLLFSLGKKKQEITTLDKQMMKTLADQTGIFARNLRLVDEIKRYNQSLKDANSHLKQLDVAKSEFMSIASHQLRTPMSGIMGYLSMLLEGDYGKFTAEQTKVLSDVFDASQRMIRLVNVFLNVTRIESGRLRINIAPVDMTALIDNEIHELILNARKKGVTLKFNRPKETIPQVEADEDKLKDVVLNLIDNAIKYTPQGSVTVAAKKLKDGVYVSVKDTGVGIEKGEDSKLFHKFVRGTGIARVQPDGSGLGLFIAKKIIEAHGGEIWVTSEGKGKGSTFQFTLPFKSKVKQVA